MLLLQANYVLPVLTNYDILIKDVLHLFKDFFLVLNESQLSHFPYTFRSAAHQHSVNCDYMNYDINNDYIT